MSEKRTGFERCMAALQWKTPDRIPVIPQNSDMAVYMTGYEMKITEFL